LIAFFDYDSAISPRGPPGGPAALKPATHAAFCHSAQAFPGIMILGSPINV
jgi:hypothetical protein